MEISKFLEAFNVPAVVIHKSGQTQFEVIHTTTALLEYCDCDFSSHDEAQRIPYDFLENKNNIRVPIEGRNEIVVPEGFENVLTLWQQANSDWLTKTSNRHGLAFAYDQLRQRVSDEGAFLLLYLDANQFKVVNDQYGHDVGDSVLIHMTKRLKRHLKKDDIVSRIGGDEFVVIMWMPNIDAINQFIKNRLPALVEYINYPYGINGGKIDLPTSFALGASVHEGVFPELDVILREAELQMYADKGTAAR